ncbi:hypothetical protein [Streptomyces sp. NPDC051014]|uniref:hypothetical protein n=1 Tax=Streptomyces sp. NPDC051014 TaxID=3155751 RepID=UPI0033E2D9DA
MPRLNVPAPEDVPAGAQRTLDDVEAQLGFAPNMFKTLASNPAVLDTVTTLVESRGRVGDADLADVRHAGYTDAQILGIVAVAVQFLLTNFINNVNQTDLDVPAADPVDATVSR